MELLIIIIFLLILGAVCFIYDKNIKELKRELERAQKEIEREREMLGGFDEFNKRATQIKEEGKQEIINKLRKTNRINTGKVADLLEVSKVTAFRYLEELEKEGKIEQVGAFGRGVEYKSK